MRTTRSLRSNHARAEANETEEASFEESDAEGEKGGASDAGHDDTAQTSAVETARTSEMSPAERHEAFLRQVLEAREAGAGKALADERFASRVSFRYGALSTGSALEAADVEEREAEAEQGAYHASNAQVIGSGLTVDDVMRRRRA